MNVVFQAPSVACAGSIYPVTTSCEVPNSSSPAVLTGLEIRMVGCSIIRARNVFLGEKAAEDKPERVRASLQNLFVANFASGLALQKTWLSIVLPMGLTPYFSSSIHANSHIQSTYATLLKWTAGVSKARNRMID